MGDTTNLILNAFYQTKVKNISFTLSGSVSLGRWVLIDFVLNQLTFIGYSDTV